MRHLHKAIGAGLLAVSLLVLGTGCAVPDETRRLESRLYLGVTDDVSESTTDLPRLTAENLDSLLASIARRGGGIGFGTIGEKARTSLIRLDLLPVQGLLNERAQTAAANRKSTEAWRPQVVQRIQQPRAEQRTAFHCVLQRLKLFLEEPTVPRDAERAVLIVSDGINTVGECQPVRFGSEVRVLVVGMDNDRAGVLGERVELFESVTAAVGALVERDDRSR